MLSSLDSQIKLLQVWLMVHYLESLTKYGIVMSNRVFVL